MSFEPLKEPPRNVRKLEAAVSEYAQANGVSVGRVRRSISFTVLVAVLERCKAFDGSPLFLIKGGVAIERRLGAEARATKDFDAIFLESSDRVVAQVDSAFRQPYEQWTLRRDGEPEDIGKALRINVKLEYEGKSWGTVPLEVSGAEGSAIPHENVPAVDISVFGLAGPDSLPCLPLRRQIAQKLHAVTEPPATEGGENRRFRDLFDIWRLSKQVSVDHELRGECKQIFEIRGKHSWPPTVTTYPSWAASLRRMAEDEGIDCPVDTELVAIVQTLVDRIDALSTYVFAAEYAEIQEVLSKNTDLKANVLRLVRESAIPGKVTEGGDREARFRSLLERLVSGEISTEEAISRTEEYLARSTSTHRNDNRVFAQNWANRLVRTQYSRFYNQGVAELLLSAGEVECFVPHSSSEEPTSRCSKELAGRPHDLRMLYDRLIDAYQAGNWNSDLKVPNHPHCTHVIAPTNKEIVGLRRV